MLNPITKVGTAIPSMLKMPALSIGLLFRTVMSSRVAVRRL